jgi:hypothetical protein
MAKKPAKEYEFHPLANDYPLMTDEQLEVLVEDMKEHGFDPRFPIVLYEGKILAGRDRYRAAIKAGVTPKFVTLGKGENPREFVERENEFRKHFTPEFLEAKRKARNERIIKAREAGDSIRRIADKEKTSKSQVGRVLADAQVSPAGQVRGKDEKTYPPTKPKLIPELKAALDHHGCSPKKLPEIEALPPGKQLDLSREIVAMGGNVGKALHKVSNQREPGDDTEVEKNEKKQTKNGQVIFDWSEFRTHVGGLVRLQDRLYRAHGEVNHIGQVQADAGYENLRRLLQAYIDGFKKRYEEISKQKAPERLA